jgi:dTDP-4-dehydrorhamnose 3,5-epimerase
MADTTNFEIRKTSIPGLLEITIPTFGDSRGWFKENYQKSKLEAIGLPEFKIVQNNISFNAEVGVTRGIHAEPWEKYISLAAGKVFAAIVDLRAGDSFGKVETFKLTPERAIFVPRGCGNSFQTLEPNTTYTYLVNEHWSAEAQAQYTFCNLFDDTLNIEWPIPRDKAVLSDKDLNHPALKNVVPMQVNK